MLYQLTKTIILTISRPFYGMLARPQHFKLMKYRAFGPIFCHTAPMVRVVIAVHYES